MSVNKKQYIQGPLHNKRVLGMYMYPYHYQNKNENFCNKNMLQVLILQ